MERVYFPFADQILGYDCAACDARCCRGPGFGATREEVCRLSALCPSLGHFVQPTATPGYLKVQDVGPCCFFLGQDGRCRVQVTAGWESKPYVCKTFPVNQYTRLGHVLVADLHPLCPVQLCAPATKIHPLVHAELARQMEPYSELILSRATRRPGFDHLGKKQIDDLFDHEARCRDLLASRLSADPLQLAALCGALEQRSACVTERNRQDEKGRAPQEPTEAELAGHQEALRPYDRSLRAFLCPGPHPQERPDPRAGALLAAVAPRLRRVLLEGLAGVPHACIAGAFPRVLLALEVYRELLAAAGACAPTLAAVSDLALGSWRLLWLLSHIDQVPLIECPAPDTLTVRIPASQVGPVRRLVSFIHRDNPSLRLTLREVLERVLADSDQIMDRLLVLRSLDPPLLVRLRWAPA